MTVKLYREVVVGHGRKHSRYKMPPSAFMQAEREAWRHKKADDSVLRSLDPGFWKHVFTPQWGEDGVIVRYPDGIDLDFPRHRETGKGGNHFGQTAQLLLDGQTEWVQAQKDAAEDAIASGIEVFWYRGAMGRSALDAMAKPIVDSMPGTNIIDASNGGKFVQKFWSSDYWGEAWPDTKEEAQRQAGSFCFGRNLRTQSGDQKLFTVAERRRRYPGMFGAIASFFGDDDAEWLMRSDLAERMRPSADVPNWQTLMQLGVSLAFRGDEDDVNRFLGDRLDEVRAMRESRDG